MPDSPAVKAWRDKTKLNLSASWKRDVTITIKDVVLWQEILDNWKWQDSKGKWHKKHPGIKQLLDVYELEERLRKERAIQQESGRVHSQEGISERTERGVSKSAMPSLFERSGSWQG